MLMMMLIRMIKKRDAEKEKEEESKQAWQSRWTSRKGPWKYTPRTADDGCHITHSLAMLPS
jgi:hypothetical protein